METDGNILPELFQRLFQVLADGSLVLAVHQDFASVDAEEGLQHFRAIYQQISGRRTHEDLDARCSGDAGQTGGIVGCGADMETVIGPEPSIGPRQFVLQGFGRGGRGEGVGHIDAGGDATQQGCARFGGHIGLLHHPGFPEMDVGVDAACHQHFPLQVHDFRSFRQGTATGFFHGVLSITDSADAPVIYGKGALFGRRPRYDLCPGKKDHSFRGCSLRNRSLRTPQKASPKIPLLILDSPSFRLMKMMGTSAILKPSR